MAEPHSPAEQAAAARDLAVSLIRRPRLVRELPRWLRARPERRQPLTARQPWWNFQAIDAVGARLQAGSRVVEYGGGGSTLWLLDRGCSVRTIEHDAAWFADLTARLGEQGRIELHPLEGDGADYVDAVAAEPDGSLDLVIVDGRERVRCGLAAKGKIKPGGMLLLDDADRARYAPLHDALTDWRAEHLVGLKNGDWSARQTSVWTRRPD